jgi:hypothetical protein
MNNWPELRPKCRRTPSAGWPQWSLASPSSALKPSSTSATFATRHLPGSISRWSLPFFPLNATLEPNEPFGALDALTREQTRLDLEQLWLRTRETVVFITHSIDEAVLLADRVVVLSPRPGRIERIIDVDIPRPRRFDGRKSPRFLATNDEITEFFFGTRRPAAFVDLQPSIGARGQETTISLQGSVLAVILLEVTRCRGLRPRS